MRKRDRLSPDRMVAMDSIFSWQFASNRQIQGAQRAPSAERERDLGSYSSEPAGGAMDEEKILTPRCGRPELFYAWRAAVQEIQSVPGKSAAALLRLRADYARAFHPDKLPSELSSIANEKMADVNARIDAALSQA